MTAELTEMPRSRSIVIQSERARRRSPRALTSPAMWIAPANSSSFSVRVVLPASGCEMMAKVRRRAVSAAIWGVLMAQFYFDKEKEARGDGKDPPAARGRRDRAARHRHVRPAAHA